MKPEDFYRDLLPPARDPTAPGPVVSLDTIGKVRYARIRYGDKEVRERVPLHVWKLGDEAQEAFFRGCIMRLRVEMAKRYKLCV